jgi:hypothetical protein
MNKLIDPTIHPSTRARAYTNGPRGVSSPVFNSELDDKPSSNGATKEAERLHKLYMNQKTQEHYESLRKKGNLSALKLLGLTIIAYAYMNLAVMLSSYN